MWSSITCGTQRGIIIAGTGEIYPCRQSGALCAGGFLAGADIALNGAVLRSAPLLLMGSGIGSLSVSQLLAATGEMLQAAGAGEIDHRHHPAAAAGDRGGLATGRQPEAHGFHPRIKKSLPHKKMGLIS